ncbi:MAG: ribonuclease H-like domain-containing protein [Clostridiales bacterium]|nr:ribonuclease H-like domain-containing protein [Clostridiales bacterium]
MASMLDRLRAAQPVNHQARLALKQSELLIKETKAPLPPGRSFLSAQTLAYLGLENGADIPLEAFLFLDTETTGLRGGAGTLAFLIGVGWFEGDDFRVRQYLIRDYHQEAQMLDKVFAQFEEARCLVTFNGASFDLPLLESRATVNRLKERYQPPLHLDVIHAARRVYKLRLRQCALSRLEEQVFGQPREDDLPGADIPARFFEYLKTRDEGLMTEVLRHNYLDILSLARLKLLMSHLHENPMDARHHRDIFSLGKVYEKHGQVEKAASCFRACTDQDVKARAWVRLGDMYKRCKSNLKAADAYEAVLEESSMSFHVCTALAKIYEHRLKDPGRALAIVRQGMLYCAERRQLSARAAAEYAALEHRCLRLMRKVEHCKHGIYEQTENAPGAAEAPARTDKRSAGPL